uniref:Portal protein n=1 Tax=viral metagenome TaxID=1070528 RepID=A0A6M3XHT4_9ZZZZ
MLEILKNVVEASKNKIQKNKDAKDMVNKARLLNDEFDLAKLEKVQWDAKFDREETIYMGDRKFGNIYSESAADDARTAVRVSQAFIEAQIDLSIPDAVFKPVSQDDESAVKELQSEVDYCLRSNDLDEMNSLSEREVKKYGMVAYKVLWDNNYIGAGYRGRPQVICIHPKNILWASGTTDRNKCRCWYHVENETYAECIKRYGDASKSLPRLGEIADIDYDKVGSVEETNVNGTNDVNVNPDLVSRNSNHPLAKYVIVEKWYLDDDDECCMTTFSGDCVLLEVPKFYHRRKYENEEYVKDENGNEVLEEKEIVEEDYKFQTREEMLSAGTEVTYYRPRGTKSIPIIIQNNIPRSKAIPGISDIERTYDYEQSMKKVLYKHEERMLKGNTKILYNKMQEEEASGMLDNDDLNIIPVVDVNNFKVVDFKADDRMTLEFYEFLLNQLQFQTGVTASFQGMPQGEAKSGKAIQSLVNQTAEKISLKVSEKNMTYKRIYRLMCNFILCFSDGDRPYRLDNTLQPEYGTFNKLDMVKRDQSGNVMWIDWDVEVSAEQGFPKTKTAMMEMILELAGGGYFEPTPVNLLLWQTLVKLGFPNAESILQSIQNELKNQAMIQQQQMQQQQMQQQQAEQQTQQQAMEQQALEQQKMQEQQVDKQLDRQLKQQRLQQGQDKESEKQQQLMAVIQQLPPDIREAFLNMTPEQQVEALGGM